MSQNFYVIARPNGVGKTTFARKFLMGNVAAPSPEILKLPLEVRAEMALRAPVDEVIEEHARMGGRFTFGKTAKSSRYPLTNS